MSLIAAWLKEANKKEPPALLHTMKYMVFNVPTTLDHSQHGVETPLEFNSRLAIGLGLIFVARATSRFPSRKTPMTTQGVEYPSVESIPSHRQSSLSMVNKYVFVRTVGWFIPT